MIFENLLTPYAYNKQKLVLISKIEWDNKKALSVQE